MLWLLIPIPSKTRRRRVEAVLEQLAGRARDGGAVASLREAEPKLAAELDRARRYEHPFATVVLSTQQNGTPGNGASGREGSGSSGESSLVIETSFPRLVSLMVGGLLKEALRGSDVLAYAAGENRFLILLTESGPREAEQAVARLDRLLREQLHMKARVGMALFPDDGLTIDDLVERATDAWRTDAPRLALETADDSGDDVYAGGAA